MACNCKKKIEIEEEYGERQEEGMFGRIGRYIGRLAMILIVAGLFVVVFPLVLFILLYQVLRGKELEVSLPNFITRRLKR